MCSAVEKYFRTCLTKYTLDFENDINFFEDSQLELKFMHCQLEMHIDFPISRVNIVQIAKQSPILKFIKCIFCEAFFRLSTIGLINDVCQFLDIETAN